MSRPGWWATPGGPTSRARTWTTRGVVNGCVAALVAVAAAGSALFGAGRSGQPVAQAWGTEVPASLAAARVGCGPIQLVSDPSSVVGTVDVDSVLPYDTVPPAAGWFSRTPAAADELDAAPEQVLAAMWAGQREVWVSSDIAGIGLDQLKETVAAHPSWHAVVRRWPHGRGEQIPAGSVALASWGAVQTCEEFDIAVADAFFSKAPPAPGSDAATPPVAFTRSSADKG